MPFDPALAERDYCYLTTAGRVSGKPHTIEIWFAVIGETLYMLSGGHEHSDWVRNLRKTPQVKLRIGRRRWDAAARIVTAKREDARARKAVAGKYRARGEGDLDEWERDALVIAVDITE